MLGCVLIRRVSTWMVIRGEWEKKGELLHQRSRDRPKLTPPKLKSPTTQSSRGLGLQDSLSSQSQADQASESDERCEACALVRSGVVACGVGSWLAGAEVAVESDVVVISGPHITGRVVVPHQHIGTLDELPPPGRAHVLAAVRRAVTVVSAGDAQTQARVILSTDSPASSSHVSFHVLPQDPHCALSSTAVASWAYASHRACMIARGRQARHRCSPARTGLPGDDSQILDGSKLASDLAKK